MANVVPAVAAKAKSNTANVLQESVGTLSTAPVLTESTNTTPYGFATKAQADAILVAVSELRQIVKNAGLAS